MAFHTASVAVAVAAAALLCVLVLAASSVTVSARTVTIFNNRARRDTTGEYVDAHDGKIVEHNGTYFLYGEAYGNQSLATPYPWKQWPRLKVYTRFGARRYEPRLSSHDSCSACSCCSPL